MLISWQRDVSIKYNQQCSKYRSVEKYVGELVYSANKSGAMIQLKYCWKKVWRYQRGNNKPSIEEEHTM
jgi:hypothetical protein